jgi:hypothetical protein
MAREQDPEDIVYPKRRWPWFVLLALIVAVGAIGGFVAYLRSTRLATFRLDGPRGCEVHVVFGAQSAVTHRTVTLPWEAGIDVRGGDALLLSGTPSGSCSTATLRCSIDVDTRARTTGSDACAEYVGRVWAMVPGMR